MSDRRVGAWMSLLRQSLSIGYDFGAHPLEALLWVAETVERSVYEPGSLVRTPQGYAFTLANPPLRSGAFSGARLSIDRQAVEPQAFFVRERGRTWRSAGALSRSAPLRLAPGERTEFRVDIPPTAEPKPMAIRLEFDSVAIPPLVWFEFEDLPREVGP
jgi:hypothetical protein